MLILKVALGAGQLPQPAVTDIDLWGQEKDVPLSLKKMGEFGPCLPS